jgi:carotenoid cleavage dioxygenase
MAHGLRLRDGKAHWYRNRWVRSAAVARALGETWAGGAHAGGVDFAANTNIIGHAGKTLAIAESGVRPYELTYELETVGPSNFCGTLFGGCIGRISVPRHDSHGFADARCRRRDGDGAHSRDSPPHADRGRHHLRI